MRKIIITFILLSFGSLSAESLYENSLENADQLKKTIFSQMNSYVCVPYLFKMSEMKYLCGTDAVLSVFDKVKNTSTNDFAAMIAEGLYDDIELKSGKKDVSVYVTNGSTINRWKIAKENYLGLNDLYSPSADVKNSSFVNAFVSSPDGYLLADNYLSGYFGPAVMDSEVSVSSPGILMIDSDSEYVLYCGGAVVVDNTGNKRRVMRFAAVSRGKTPFRVKFMCRGSSESYSFSRIRITLLDAKFKKTKQKDIKEKGNITPLEDPAAMALEKSGEYDLLADYLSDLGSIDAGYFYRKALNKNSECRLNYADWLYREYGNGAMLSSVTDFGDNPKRDERLFEMKKLVSEKRYFEALPLCEKLLEEKPTYDCRKNYIWILYNVSLNARFSAECDKFAADYPEDIDIMILRVYKDIQLTGSSDNKTISAVLSKSRGRGFAKKIYSKLSAEGKYSAAAAVAERYYKYGENDFTLMYCNSLIEKGEERKAVKILLSQSVKGESFALYAILDSLERKKTSAKGMYFEKLRYLAPENSSLDGFDRYVSDGNFSGMFDAYRSTDKIEKEINIFVRNGLPVERDILFSGDYVIAFRGGKMRAFREYLVYIRNDSDADEYGEVRIPSGSQIAAIRVYYRDGTFSDSYRTSNGGKLGNVSIDGARPDSLLHVAYELNTFDYNYSGSRFFSSMIFSFQEYWRSMKSGEVKLINRSGEEIKLYNSMNIPVDSARYQDETISQFKVENIQPKKRENNSGYFSESLISYALWNVRSEAEFCEIIKSRNHESDVHIPESALVKDTEDSLIESVCSYVNSAVESAGGFDYAPADFNLMLARKKGDIEDKAYFAKYILEKYGIEARIAYVRAPYAAEMEFFNDRFKGVLLYVRKKDSGAIWIDFSSKYYSCGTVSSEYTGETAAVISDKGIDFIKVKSSLPGKVRTEWKISAADRKFSFKTDFSGELLRYKSYFTDRRYIEKNLLTMLQIYKADIAFDSFEYFDSRMSFSGLGTISLANAETGHDMILSPFLRDSAVSQYSLSVERESAVVVDEPLDEEDSYEYILPDKYLFCGVESKKRIVYGNAFAEFTIEKKKGSRVLKAVQKVYLPKCRIKISDYPEFSRFCIDIKKEEKYQAVIKSDEKNN